MGFLNKNKDLNKHMACTSQYRKNEKTVKRKKLREKSTTVGIKPRNQESVVIESLDEWHLHFLRRQANAVDTALAFHGKVMGANCEILHNQGPRKDWPGWIFFSWVFCVLDKYCAKYKRKRGVMVNLFSLQCMIG